MTYKSDNSHNIKITTATCFLMVAVVILALVSFSTPVVKAENTAPLLDAILTDVGGNALSSLTDSNTASGVTFYEGDTMKIMTTQPISGLYIVWERYPDSGFSLSHIEGESTHNTGFFQEYTPLETTDVSELTLTFHSSGKPVSVTAYGEGHLPSEVHDWTLPVERADILILSTHSDDEHLFFGGVMPTYFDRGDVSIQLAYMVNHSTEPYRQQELLNGLWEAGMRNYPIIPDFPDMYSESLAHAKTIYDEEEIVNYVVNLYQTYAPLVVVGHDLNGEYGHGAHMLYAESAIKAIEESHYKPQKLYLHLYGENEIITEVDTPLESFDGRTAFEVAEDAFAHHRSQQTYFEVEKDGPYDLRKFGLQYSTVGHDTGNDMLENIVTYSEQTRLAEEQRLQELAEAEAAKAKAEEEARLLAEAEAEAAAAEEEARLKAEAEALVQAEQERQELVRNVIIVVCVVVVLVVVIIIYRKTTHRNTHSTHYKKSK